jgi:DNA-binding MarR family transcriptional regulator
VFEVWRAMQDEYSRQADGTVRASDHGFVPVLRAVIRQPGITINELARQSQMPKSGVSVMMARLVEMGIVRKESDPHDSRLVRLSLTPEGRRRVKSWRAARQRAFVRTLKHLSDDQMGVVVTGLQLLLSALRRKGRETC